MKRFLSTKSQRMHRRRVERESTRLFAAWRHVLRRTVGYFLIGCLTSTGIAFTCAVRSVHDLEHAIQGRRADYLTSHHATIRWDHFGSTRLLTSPVFRTPHSPHEILPDDLMPKWSLQTAEDPFFETEVIYLLEEAAGWPMRCFAASLVWLSPVSADPLPSLPSADPRVRQRYGILIPAANIDLRIDPTFFKTRFLPLQPLWIPLVLNSAFWGLCWGLIFGARRGAIHKHRRRRNRCIQCGYDLRGTDPNLGCSECGWNRPMSEGVQSV